MAKNTNPKRRPAQTDSARPQTKASPKKRTQEAAAEEATTGNILWRIALIFCTALVIVSLIIASVNGGSDLVGAPAKKPDAAPTPPVASVNPGQSVSGSAATPIPPTPSPEVTPAA